MPGRYPEEGIVPARQINESYMLKDKHFSSKMPLVDGVPLGSVKDNDLLPLHTRGYVCESTRSVFETDIARVLKGEIDLKKLAESRPRVKCCAVMVGHNKVLIKVVDRTHVSSKFVTKILPQDLKAICPLRFHPNIALSYDSFLSHTHVYLVSEFTAGLDVATYMARHRHNEDVARNLFGQIVSAFKYAHSREVVHRDFKSASIMVDEAGHVKILDFGLSPKLSIVKKAQLHETTKRAYMAPEVIKSRRYESMEGDIYSMGVVLYEMLHGCLPYVGQKEEVLHQIRLRALRFYVRVSQEAKVLIKQMVHPDPWKRPKIAECQDDPWTCGVTVYSPSPPKTPKPSYAHEPSPVYYRPGHNKQTCSPGTVKRGPDHIMLRSRIPDKKTAYAMDIDFPRMCTKFDPKSKTSDKNEKCSQESPIPKVTVSPKPKLPLYKNMSCASQIPKDIKKSPEALDKVRSIESALLIRSIPKPTVVSPTKEEEEIEDYCLEDLFSVNPASTESSVSVIAFNHADSEYSYDDSEYEPVAAVGQPVKSDTKYGDQNDMPPLTVNTPVSMKGSDTSLVSADARSQPCSAFMVEHPVHGVDNYDDISSDDGGDDLSKAASVVCSSTATEEVVEDQSEEIDEDAVRAVHVEEAIQTGNDEAPSEVLTAVSFKSERASTVPSDLGSMEPPYMGIQYRCRRLKPEDKVNLSECMQLPAVSREEQVMQFLSTVPYDDKLRKPSSQPKLPAIQPQQMPAYVQKKHSTQVPGRKPQRPAPKSQSVSLPPIMVAAMTISRQKVSPVKALRLDSVVKEETTMPQVHVEAYEETDKQAVTCEPLFDQIVVSVPREELPSQRSSSENGFQDEDVNAMHRNRTILSVEVETAGRCSKTLRTSRIGDGIPDDRIKEEKTHVPRSLEPSLSDSQILSSTTNSVFNELKNSASGICDVLPNKPISKRLTINNLLNLSEPIPFRSQTNCKNVITRDQVVKPGYSSKPHSQQFPVKHSVPVISGKPLNHSIPIIKGTTLNKFMQKPKRDVPYKHQLLPNRMTLPKAKHHAAPQVERLKKHSIVDLELTVEKVPLKSNNSRNNFDCKGRDDFHPGRKFQSHLLDHKPKYRVR